MTGVNLHAEFGKQVCQRDDRAARMFPEPEKMSITSNDPLCFCGQRTFENAIVRRILEDVKGRAGPQHSRDVTDFLNRLPSSVFCPIKLRLEHPGGFRQDGDGGEQLEAAVDCFEVGRWACAVTVLVDLFDCNGS